MGSATKDELQSFVREVQLVGRGSGRVKLLRGFDKSRHSVPDAVNHATSAFLARLAALELAAEAEQIFQAARTLLKYKRKELSLDVTSPTALLTARDFTFEVNYSLDERAPDEYVVTRTLHQVANASLVRQPEFNELFAAQFSEVVVVLRKGVRVEAVIDAVEALEDARGLQVDYPSDCRLCTLTVDGVEAEVVCDGGSLAMRFPRPGAPIELLEAFAAVRLAFVLSKQQVLAGLVG